MTADPSRRRPRIKLETRDLGDRAQVFVLTILSIRSPRQRGCTVAEACGTRNRGEHKAYPSAREIAQVRLLARFVAAIPLY